MAEVDLALAEDHEIIRRAAREKRICITRDADFHALLATGGQPRPRSFEFEFETLTAQDTVDLIENRLPTFRDDLRSGALVTITSRQIRRRRMPITP